MIEVVRSPLLAGTRHGFLGRRGGVSGGVMAGLNAGLGSSDDLPAVVENRRLAVEAVAPGAALVTVYQVHSADVVTVTRAVADDARAHADAMVTAVPDLVLGIVTADCAPVLLADGEAGVIGAAHAGWKGAIGGICEATVAAMATLGAKRSRIAAAVGPCIARASYEVDAVFFKRFAATDPANERFFAGARREGHYCFDLEAYVVHQLAVAGIERIEALGDDTYAQPERYFSFRRATHMGEPDYGRQISLIARA